MTSESGSYEKLVDQIQKYNSAPWTIEPGMHVTVLRFTGPNQIGTVESFSQPPHPFAPHLEYQYPDEWNIRLDDGKLVKAFAPVIIPDGTDKEN